MTKSKTTQEQPPYLCPTFWNFLRLLRVFLTSVQRILQRTEPLADGTRVFITQLFNVQYSHCTGERIPRVKKKSCPKSTSKFQEKDADAPCPLQTSCPILSGPQTLTLHWPFVKFLPTQRWLHREWAEEQGTKNTPRHLDFKGTAGVFHSKIVNLNLRLRKRGFQLPKKMFISSVS